MSATRPTAVAAAATGSAPSPTPTARWSRRRGASPNLWTPLSLVALAGSVVAAVGLGPVPVPVAVVWQVLGHHTIGIPDQSSWTVTEDSIVWLVRLPRVLLAVLVGALLAVSGAAVQALVRNILAEPYLIGVSSGAAVGATTVILFGGALGLASATSLGLLTTGAFVGGLLATAAVFTIARIGGRITSVRLILTGVAVSYGLSAVTSALVLTADSRDGARGVLFWLLGSLQAARWSAIVLPAILLLVGGGLLWLWGRRLDALSIGDDVALSLGVDPDRFRTWALVVVAVCVGAAVAVSGPIGFVGLVIPHLARLAVGSSHRRLLPLAAVLGALCLVWADVLARILLAPRELPLGVVTAVVGAPALLLLVRRFAGPQS